jgi:uncharacterized protein
MTAASAFPPESSEGRSSEPSMEDILASIRRIIADDQTQGGPSPAPGNGAARRAASPAPEGDRGLTRTRTPYDDVLDLARVAPADRSVPVQSAETAAPHSPAASLQPVSDSSDHLRDHPGNDPQTPVTGLRARLPEPLARGATQGEDGDMSEYAVPAVPHDGEGDLLSAPLGESVMSAFETLAATVVLQNTPMLERVMRDLLRPMLKTWLDDNLPGLVERLVRAEIERVARGTRG